MVSSWSLNSSSFTKFKNVLQFLNLSLINLFHTFKPKFLRYIFNIILPSTKNSPKFYILLFISKKIVYSSMITSRFATCNARIIAPCDYFIHIWLRRYVTNFLHSAIITCLLLLYPLIWTFYTNTIKLFIFQYMQGQVLYKNGQNWLYYCFLYKWITVMSILKFQSLATVVRVAANFTGLLKIKKHVFTFDLSCVEIK